MRLPARALLEAMLRAHEHVDPEVEHDLRRLPLEAYDCVDEYFLVDLYQAFEAARYRAR